MCVCVSGVNYPRTLSVCKSLKTLNCIVSAISLSSATKCSTHSKPDIPSKVFKPHRLTFKYLSFKLQPKCRNDLSELLCKSNAIKFGRNMCIWCKPNTSDETRIWMYVIVSRHSDWDAFRCWMARRRVPVYPTVIHSNQGDARWIRGECYARNKYKVRWNQRFLHIFGRKCLTRIASNVPNSWCIGDGIMGAGTCTRSMDWLACNAPMLTKPKLLRLLNDRFDSELFALDELCDSNELLIESVSSVAGKSDFVIFLQFTCNVDRKNYCTINCDTLRLFNLLVLRTSIFFFGYVKCIFVHWRSHQ